MAANDDMVALWNGPDTAAWATHPDRYDRMLHPFGERVLGAAELQPHERVLDVGCGAGALTLAAAAVVTEGHATGADIARPLLDLARRRTAEASTENVDFVDADVQTASLPRAPFDAIISRFGVMFFDDPVAAFTNLRRHVTDTGRLAFTCWQPLGSNEWAMVPVLAALPHIGVPEAPAPDAPGPFAFGDPDRIRTVLGSAGWAVTAIDGLEVPIHVGGASDEDEALVYYQEDAFGKVLFGSGDTAAREAAADSLRAALTEHVTDEGVRLGAATWIVTATASTS